MNINFQCDKLDYEVFRKEVGYGNVSRALRNFVLSYSNTKSLNEKKLRKELELIGPQYNEIRTKYFKLKEKLEAIDHKRKQAELINIGALEKEKNKVQKIQGETMKTFLHEAV